MLSTFGYFYFWLVNFFLFFRGEGAVGGSESTLACVDDISQLR